MTVAEVKVVVVGDSTANKTAILSHIAKAAASDNDVTVSENIELTTEHQGQPVHLQLLDTTGQEGFLRMRALSYPKTDVFLLCFSFLDLQSFTNIKENWLPETRQTAPQVTGQTNDHAVQVLSYCPTAVLLIVGADHDQLLLDGPGEPKRPEGEAPTPDQGRALADDLKPKAIGFIDLSTTTGNGAQELMTQVLSHVVPTKQKGGRPAVAAPSQPTMKRGSLVDRAKSTLRRNKHGGAPPAEVAAVVQASTTPTTNTAAAAPAPSSSSNASGSGTTRKFGFATLRGLRSSRNKEEATEGGPS